MDNAHSAGCQRRTKRADVLAKEVLAGGFLALLFRCIVSREFLHTDHTLSSILVTTNGFLNKCRGSFGYFLCNLTIRFPPFLSPPMGFSINAGAVLATFFA